MWEKREIKTYIFPDNRTKTRTPKNSRTANLVHEEPFAAEHGFAYTLALVLRHDTLRACEKSVTSHTPRIIPTKLDDGNIADSRRSQEQFSGAGICGFCHVAAN